MVPIDYKNNLTETLTSLKVDSVDFLSTESIQSAVK